jgi:hypothetical protein
MENLTGTNSATFKNTTFSDYILTPLEYCDMFSNVSEVSIESIFRVKGQTVQTGRMPNRFAKCKLVVRKV